VDALMSAYAADVETFDVVAPLGSRGSDAVRQRVVEWFASFETLIHYEVSRVRLAVAGDVAFDHHFTRVQGTNKRGDKINMWFRETIGYRRIDGRWKVSHQHSSVPFDMTNGKARLDLQPPGAR
jgi:ketosteroid isomerase-like protein